MSKVTIYGVEHDALCSKPIGKPRCGKYIPPAKTKPEGYCGLSVGHSSKYCVRTGTVKVPEPDVCGLKSGHNDHCSGTRSIEQKKASKRAKHVPKTSHRGRPADLGNSFSRGDLDRLKVWIGCQIPGGCPAGLSGHPDGRERRPEWFDWDHTDPALKVRRSKGQSGSRLSGGNRFSFELMTEIFETEALRVLCKLCHATVTKEQQLKPNSERPALREKPGAVTYEIDWSE